MSATLAAASEGKTEKSQLTRSRVRSAWLFLTPMIVVVLMVAGWPLARTIYFSMTDASLSNLDSFNFVGFENYLAYLDYGDGDGEWIGVLADAKWWNAVWNTIYFAVVSVTLETILGLAIALVLNASFPGRGLVRTAMLIPWAIPTIVSAQMWGWMLHDQYGVINDLLMRAGLIEQNLAWTADNDLAMTAVIMADVWKTTPFMTLLILAALQMLPTDCYEAARVDGISPIKVFFKVTLPLIKPALMVAIIFRLLDALRVFDLIFVLTSNSESTMSMSVYARQQLVEFSNVGMGSAASTVLFLIVALCTVIYLVAGRVKLD